MSHILDRFANLAYLVLSIFFVEHFHYPLRWLGIFNSFAEEMEGFNLAKVAGRE